LLYCELASAWHFIWCWRLAEVVEAAVEQTAAAEVAAHPQILRRRRKLYRKPTC
jgi:hypothetical protein